jgi:Flp pilus assembly protein TadG
MRNWTDDISGQAVLEFALIAPIFLLLLFSIITIGYWMNAQQIITQAAREAVRIGAITNDNLQIEAAALASMASLDSNTDRITVFVDPLQETDPLRQRGNPLTVRIEYDLPIVLESLPTEFQKVSAQSVARIEYVP